MTVLYFSLALCCQAVRVNWTCYYCDRRGFWDRSELQLQCDSWEALQQRYKSLSDLIHLHVLFSCVKQHIVFAELKDSCVAVSSSSLNSENPYATIKDLPGLPLCPPESSYMEMKSAVPRQRSYTQIISPPLMTAPALPCTGGLISKTADIILFLLISEC